MIWLLALFEAANLCKMSSKAKLLIKDRVVDNYSFYQMEELINQLPSFGFKNLKVSVYIAKSVRQFTNYFGESLASRQGVRLKVFISFDAAAKWLLES